MTRLANENDQTPRHQSLINSSKVLERISTDRTRPVNGDLTLPSVWSALRLSTLAYEADAVYITDDLTRTLRVWSR